MAGFILLFGVFLIYLSATGKLSKVIAVIRGIPGNSIIPPKL